MPVTAYGINSLQFPGHSRRQLTALSIPGRHGLGAELFEGRMMDLELSREQKSVMEMSRRFAREVVAPRAALFERTGQHPYDIVAPIWG